MEETVYLINNVAFPIVVLVSIGWAVRYLLPDIKDSIQAHASLVRTFESHIVIYAKSIEGIEQAIEGIQAVLQWRQAEQGRRQNGQQGRRKKAA